MNNVLTRPLWNDFLFDNHPLVPRFHGYYDRSEKVWSDPQFEADEHEYRITIDIPGVTKDQIAIEIDKTFLIVKTNEDDSNTASKRSYNFRYKIPDDIDKTKVSAHLKHGVLQLHLKKTEESKALQVQIT